MVDKADIYMTETTQIAADTSNVTLVGDPIPSGRVVEITIIAIKDETTTGKTVRIGYDRNGTKYWLMEFPASTNYHGGELTATLYLTENERPAGMVESPTASDEIKLFARGKYI